MCPLWLRQRLHALAWLHVNELDLGEPLDLVEMFAGVKTVTKGGIPHNWLVCGVCV